MDEEYVSPFYFLDKCLRKQFHSRAFLAMMNDEVSLLIIKQTRDKQ